MVRGSADPVRLFQFVIMTLVLQEAHQSHDHER
jgi:hypothetical protein